VSAAQVVDDPERSRFEVVLDGQVAGFAEYHRSTAGTAFTHTVIEPQFEGRGLASVLVRSALDSTRTEGRAVLPFCPFVRGYIAKHPEEYLDLVPADRRTQFDLPASDRAHPGSVTSA
jgi:predicted GNAT family acetyltransferase